MKQVKFAEVTATPTRTLKIKKNAKGETVFYHELTYPSGSQQSSQQSVKSPRSAKSEIASGFSRRSVDRAEKRSQYTQDPDPSVRHDGQRNNEIEFYGTFLE